MMDWRRIKYTPVEDTKGKLVGLVTARIILRHLIQDPKLTKETNLVEDIMIEKPVTISPEATILEAMEKMRKHKIGCLPVVKKRELIGLITEMDFLSISGRLIERLEGK